MKQFFIILIGLFLSFTTVSSAQSSGSDQIHSIKIGLITNKMKLSPDQSAKFWPVYNQYESELRSINRSRKNITQNKGMDAHEIIDERQRLDEKALQVKNKYRSEFLNIITPQQLNKMYEAEAEFKEILLKRVSNSK